MQQDQPIPLRRWVPAGLFLVGLAAYFARLIAAPPGISGDASRLGIWAFDFLHANAWPFYIYHLFAPNPLIVYLQAPVFAAFSFTLTAQRALTAFIGALTVPAVYAACGELLSGRGRRFAHRAGLIAALGMALNPFLAEFSHYGTEHVLLPLLSLLTAAFLWRGLRRGGWVDFALAGLALGLSQYAYIGARFWPLALGLAMLAALAADPRGVGRRWRGLLIAAGVAALIALPQWLMFIRWPYTFTARSAPGQAGQFIFGMDGAGALFAEKLINQIKALVWRWPTPYYFTDAPGRPLLDPVFAVLLVAGIAAALWKRRRGPLFALAAVLVMLVPDLITFEGTQASATRLIGAVPWLYVVAGGGGASGVQYFESEVGARRALPLHAIPNLVLFLVILAGAERQLHFSRVEVPRMQAIDGYEWRTSAVEIVEADLISQHPGAKILIPSSEYQRAPLTFLLADRYPARHGGLDAPLNPGDPLIVITPDDPTRPTTEGIPAGYLPDEWVLLWNGTAYFLPPLPDAVVRTGEVRTFTAANGATVAHLQSGVWQGEIAAPDPSVSLPYANGIELVGYEVPTQAAPGDTLVVTLYWRVNRPLTRDVEIFIQVHDGLSQNRAGLHTWPLHGAYRLRVWTPGEVVPITYQIDLPESMEPGSYKVIAGVYDLIGHAPVPTTDGAPWHDVAPFDVR